MLLVSPLVTCRNKDKWLLLIAPGMHKSCWFMEEGNTRRHYVTRFFCLIYTVLPASTVMDLSQKCVDGCSVLFCLYYPEVWVGNASVMGQGG